MTGWGRRVNLTVAEHDSEHAVAQAVPHADGFDQGKAKNGRLDTEHREPPNDRACDFDERRALAANGRRTYGRLYEKVRRRLASLL